MACRFYPDTNVIHLIRSSWTPVQFDSKARAADYTLCIGHQTYELARSFLYDHCQQDVKEAFDFLAEIECIDYLPQVNSCIEREIYLAETGMSLVTVVGPLNRAATKQELLKLARGSADDARSFIAKRERNVAEDKKRVTELNQASAKAAKALDRRRTKAIKSYEMLQKELAPAHPGWLQDFAKRKGHKVTRYGIDRILADPVRYPLLNTIVASQEYLYYITAFHKTEPGRDTLDDFRILVESSVCDRFVTNDEDLIKQSRRIRQFSPALSWAEFKVAFDRDGQLV